MRGIPGIVHLKCYARRATPTYAGNTLDKY